MAYTQSDVDKLQAAISSGVQSIHFDGPPARTVTFQSAAELAQALKDARADVARAANAPGTTYRLAKTKRGFDR